MEFNWIPVQHMGQQNKAISPTNYAYGSWFVVCSCGLLLVSPTHILQGYFTGTGAIIRLPQCQWSNPEEYHWMSHMNLFTTDHINKTMTNKWCTYFMEYTPCIVTSFLSQTMRFSNIFCTASTNGFVPLPRLCITRYTTICNTNLVNFMPDVQSK